MVTMILNLFNEKMNHLPNGRHLEAKLSVKSSPAGEGGEEGGGEEGGGEGGEDGGGGGVHYHF